MRGLPPACLFTLELSREGLLVLLILQSHGLGPLQLLVGLVGHHAAVHEPAEHGDQQQDLEDPPLPAGARSAPHDDAGALLPAVRDTKPRLCRWKLPRVLNFPAPLPSLPEHFQRESYKQAAAFVDIFFYFLYNECSVSLPRLQSRTFIFVIDFKCCFF